MKKKLQNKQNGVPYRELKEIETHWAMGIMSMVALAYNLALGKERQENQEFKSSLWYILSLRLAWAT